MMRRIAKRVRLYEVSPGEGALEITKQRKTRRKGRLAAGSPSIAARE